MAGPDPSLTPSTPVVAIGLEQVYATLLEVRDDVRDMKNELGELSRDSQDHEARIRTLEEKKAQQAALDELRVAIQSLSRTVWALSGGAAVVGVVGGWLLKSLGA